MLRKYKEVILYVIVGGLTTLVSLGCYYALVLTLLDPLNAYELQAANVISWICAVTFAYVANRSFVFESRNPKILAEAGRFFGARLLTLGADMLFMGLWVSVFSLSDKWGKLIAQMVVMILNYIFSKCFVFINREKTT